MATINAIGSNKPIEVSFGGTNNATVTTNALAVGGTNKIEYLPVGIDGQVLIGQTGANPTFSANITITSVTTDDIIVNNSTTTNTLSVTGLGRGVVQSSAGGVISSSEGSDGQLLIGSSSGPTTWANITSSSGDLIITDGSNSIDINASSLLRQVAVYSWNGSFVEEVQGIVTSDGTTVTVAIEKRGGGDLTVVFSDGNYAWDTTPAATVTLTAGSDTSPQMNYVYFDQATKTLMNSTTGWPSTEHAKIGMILCQSAASIQLYEPYMLHRYSTDMHDEDNNIGHIIHIDSWIRAQSATWISGVTPNLTITTQAGAPDNVIFTSSSGTVRQLHEFTFPAFSGTPDYYIVNHSSQPYKRITDLNEALETDDGISLNTYCYFSLVIWGVVSGNGTSEKLMVNLPSGYYTSSYSMDWDDYKIANFDIPSDFKNAGFLIARYDFKHTTSNGGTWTLYKYTDLRGTFPSSSAGHSSSVKSEFEDNNFRILDEGDTTKKIAFEATNITTSTTRTITMCDQDLDLRAPSFPGTVTTTGNFALPTTTSTDGQITVGGSRFLHSYGTGSTFIGKNAGNFSLAGSNNVGIGEGALTSVGFGYGNVSIGYGSSGSISGGYRNVAIGENAMASSISGTIWNVAIGYDSMKSATTGGGSTFVGGATGESVSGNNNSGFGYTALNKCTTGEANTALGTRALNNLTTGKMNVGIGHGSASPYGAGSNYTSSESSNIVIQNYGVSGDNNTIRIGTHGTGDGQQNKCYIAGIYDIDPSGSTQETVIIDSNHQLGTTSNVTGNVAINAQTGTTYTLVLSDRNKMITLDNASAITVTVPPNSSVAFPTGTQILLYQKGAGQVTVSAGTGVTVNSSDTELKTYGQYAVIGLVKIATDEWVLTGDKAS